MYSSWLQKSILLDKFSVLNILMLVCFHNLCRLCRCCLSVFICPLNSFNPAEFSRKERGWRDDVKCDRSSRRLFPMLESVNNKDPTKEQQNKRVITWYIAGRARQRTRVNVFYNRASSVRRKGLKLEKKGELADLPDRISPLFIRQSTFCLHV